MKKQGTFWDGLLVFIAGVIGMTFAVPAIVATGAWWALWGAKISTALTVAFGWPLLSFTKVACLYLAVRFFMTTYSDTGKDDYSGSKALVWVVMTPVVLWLSVISFIWLGS